MKRAGGVRCVVWAALVVGCGAGASAPVEVGDDAARASEDAREPSGGGSSGDPSTRDAGPRADARIEADGRPQADAEPDAQAPEVLLAFCRAVCGSPSDCASAAASVDADNWACEQGVCRYLGCVNDAECDATFGATGASYRCVEVPGGLRQCVASCATPTDCATPSSAVLDADNWACDAGACRYLGCTSDDECGSAFASGAPTYRCVDAPGGLPTCVETCETRDDCASPSPSVDADNFACDEGLCRFLGCLSDAECQATFSQTGGTWTCR